MAGIGVPVVSQWVGESMTDAELYEKHADELIRFASALVGPSLAEDVLAAAVASALASPSWASVVNKRAYLFRCVTTEGSRMARAAGRRLRREMRVAQSEPHVDEPLDRDVISALLALSARQRAVVYLTYWLELNAAETAGIVNCSERTVERELGRARRVLEGKLS